MTQADGTAQNEFHEQMPFTAEEWEQIPKAVQDFVLFLLARIETMEAEVADLVIGHID